MRILHLPPAQRQQLGFAQPRLVLDPAMPEPPGQATLHRAWLKPWPIRSAKDLDGADTRCTQRDTPTDHRAVPGCAKRTQRSDFAGVILGNRGMKCRHFGIAWPNVRGKLAPTAGRQARATENVHRTCGSGLVACRWCSA